MKKIDTYTEKLITKEISIILKFLLDWDGIKEYRNSNHIGLLSGLPGIILALFEYSKISPIVNDKEVLNEYIQKTIKILENTEKLTPTYCDGLAGYGIFLLKLKSNKFIDTFNEELNNQIDEILEEIDEVLEEHIDIYNEKDNLDILHGLLGIGLYFIERENKIRVNDIVKILSTTSTTTKEGYVYWKKYDSYDVFDIVLDMGNAHGIGANIFFLSKVLSKKNILTEDLTIIVNDLIDNSIKFYLNNAQIITKEIYSYYPFKILAVDFEQHTLTAENSRLGWCYGDLGVLYTLLMASILLQKKIFEKVILEKLVFVASRTLKREKHSIDAGFCHGTCGIAILFLNIYNISNNEVFWDAANYWLKETLNKKIEIQSNEYVYYGFSIPNSTEKNISILEGLTGVLICYHKFLYSEAPISEELLMIKY
ncbi:lanthionine synthetase LanC family protein [Flavobacterium chungangense]|uniref:lanthionine synthetase LanC family protein n=1 Tax=Flavobacterium chungangense TaxID=554283 RepID=UPI0004DF81F5|nr:lanthionine synthetase LanC family protein [Flavobacterium chungangense]